MKPQINDQIKAKRSNVLLEMSKQHQKEFETKQLGMVKEVLIEEKMHGIFEHMHFIEIDLF